MSSNQKMSDYGFYAWGMVVGAVILSIVAVVVGVGFVKRTEVVEPVWIGEAPRDEYVSGRYAGTDRCEVRFRDSTGKLISGFALFTHCSPDMFGEVWVIYDPENPADFQLNGERRAVPDVAYVTFALPCLFLILAGVLFVIGRRKSRRRYG